MTLIEEAITEWFGERCPEYAEGCVCCEIWKEYDALASLAQPTSTVEGEEIDLMQPLPTPPALSALEERT